MSNPTPNLKASDHTLKAQAVVVTYRAKHLELTCAESCTGGLLASCITAQPGASDIFKGSVVTYADQTKRALLGVAPEILAQDGAVSAACAAAMASGARQLFGATIALAITGIAGPGGATPNKPVGLVFFGLAVRDHPPKTRECHFQGERTQVQGQAVDFALQWLLEVGQELEV